MARGDSTETTDQPTQERVNAYPSTGVTPLLVALAILAVLLVIFLAQNTETVPVEFLGWEVEAPLFVVVLASLVAASLVTSAVSGVWRRRRRRQRTEHEELERLRRSRGG